MPHLTEQSVSNLFERLGLSAGQAALLVDESGDDTVLRIYVFDPSVQIGRIRLDRWAGFPVFVERSDPPKLHFA